MDTILRALADPTNQGWYLGLHLGISGLTIVALVAWYNIELRKTDGGRELFRDQVRAGRGVHLRIMRDIARGRYGERTRQNTNRMYWLSGLWAIVNLTSIGLLFWSQHVTRPPN